eukprot:10232269-Lingulodinium_polyedra.AAC.1
MTYKSFLQHPIIILYYIAATKVSCRLPDHAPPAHVLLGLCNASPAWNCRRDRNGAKFPG